MNEHADFDTLAAFREGLLDGPVSERIGNHVASCPECARRSAAITEVTTRLASAPAPPMPPELSLRLDQALAAEIARVGGAAAASVDGSPLAGSGRSGLNTMGRRTTGPPSRMPADGPASRAAQERSSRPPSGAKSPRRARGRMAAALRPLAAAAAGCLIVGGGFLLVHSLQGPTSKSSASSANGHTRMSNRPFPEGPAVAPRYTGLAAQVHSQKAYSSAQLQAQAAATLERYRSLVTPSKTGAITGPMQAMVPTALSNCLQRVTGGQPRVLIDNASYDGRKVLVIIAPPAAGQPGRVWVVKQGCSGSAGDVITSSTLP